MSLDKNKPVKHPLARMGICGNPWHGLGQGGVLTLPNATTRAWPQPATTWPDLAGACHRVKVPGVPEVTRTPEELAADAAAGHEWRNEAMLSGGRMQLYGRELDGWIYVDPDGVRWLASCPALHNQLRDVSASYSTTVTLDRFGDVGAPAEIHSYPITISDWGQAGTFSGWFGLDPDASGSQLRTVIDAIKPDGSAALVMIHVYNLSSPPIFSAGSPCTDALLRHPMGWLEITLGGPGASATVGVAVKKTRAQTLHTEVSAPAVDHAYAVGLYAASGPAMPWYGLIADIPAGHDTMDSSGDGCHGGHFAEISLLEGEASLLRKRLLALWYDATGAIHELDLRLDWAGTYSYPAPDFTGGAGAVSWHRDVSMASAWTHGLYLDGAAVDTVAGSYVLSSTEEQGITETSPGHFDQSTATPDSIACTVSYAGLSGTEILDQTAFGVPSIGLGLKHLIPSGGPVLGYMHPADFVTWVGVTAKSGPDEVNSRMLGGTFSEAADMATCFFGHLDWVHCDDLDVRLDLARQSPQVIGLRLLDFLAATWTYRPAATPSGAYGTSTSRPYLAAGERLYASHNTFDGAVSWLNTSPVCWV